MKNWHERIEAARERGHFADQDQVDAYSWVTCACGEQDPRIPRHEKGAPLDVALEALGREFFKAVDNNRFSAATRILGEIEKRSALVLAHVLNAPAQDLGITTAP